MAQGCPALLAKSGSDRLRGMTVWTGDIWLSLSVGHGMGHCLLQHRLHRLAEGCRRIKSPIDLNRHEGRATACVLRHDLCLFCDGYHKTIAVPMKCLNEPLLASTVTYGLAHRTHGAIERGITDKLLRPYGMA
jgi:hypothetical protein